MKIEYAIENLGISLKYESQTKYLNEIISWVNDQQNINVNQNLLFAKLFIHKLLDIKQHDFDPNVTKLNQRAMTDILKLDLEEYYKEFADTLNINLVNQMLEENGIETKHDFLKSDEELDLDKLKIQNIPKEDLSRLKISLWQIEDVKDRLNNMISNALLKYQV